MGEISWGSGEGVEAYLADTHLLADGYARDLVGASLIAYRDQKLTPTTGLPI